MRDTMQKISYFDNITVIKNKRVFNYRSVKSLLLKILLALVITILIVFNSMISSGIYKIIKLLY